MKAITFLKKIESMDARINTRLEEVESLKALATKTTSVLGGERVQSSGSQQKMADHVGKIVDITNEVNADIDRFVEYKREVLKIMDENCDPDCIQLLYSRYFQDRTWEQISCELGYSYKWVSGGLHSKALQQVQKGLDKMKE